MKENRILIKINCPTSEIFDFTMNPANTPKWIDSIVEEKTNEWPVRLGTIFRNKDKKGMWNEYEIVEFEKNKTFTMKQKNSHYRVRYTFKPLADNTTELTYFEWVEKGELQDPFSKKTLEKLKSVMEASQ